MFLSNHKDWALIGTVRYKVLTARQDTRTTTDLLDAKCKSFMSGKLLRKPYLKNIIFSALYINNIAFLMDKLMDYGTGLGIYKTLEAKNKAKGMDIAHFIYDKNKGKVYLYQLQPVDLIHKRLLELMAKLAIVFSNLPQYVGLFPGLGNI